MHRLGYHAPRKSHFIVNKSNKNNMRNDPLVTNMHLPVFYEAWRLHFAVVLRLICDDPVQQKKGPKLHAVSSATGHRQSCQHLVRAQGLALALWLLVPRTLPVFCLKPEENLF